MFRGLALCQSMLHLKFKEVQSKWYRLYRHLQPASKIIYRNFICRWMRITAMQCLCHTLKYTTTTFMICLMRLLWIPFVQSKLTSHTGIETTRIYALSSCAYTTIVLLWLPFISSVWKVCYPACTNNLHTVLLC